MPSGRSESSRTLLVRTASELQALEPEWTPLAARFETPLLDHDWFAAAAQALYRDGELQVVVVREADTATAIAPLVSSRRFPGRLGILGACAIYEPGGWLYASDSALTTLTRAVLRLGRVGALRRLPIELAERLPELARGRGFAVLRPAKPTMAVETAGGWNAVLARLSPAAARERKKMAARLRRAGDAIRITRVRPGPGEVDQLVDAFVATESAGWKGRTGSALAFDADLERFYRTYLTEAAARGRALVSALLFGTQVAAMELAVQAYGRLWALKIGYDERFGALGPGLLLADASIRASFDEGLRGYEFLGAAEPWQERWAPVAREFRSVTLYPFSSRGLLALGSDAVHYLGRRMPVSRPA